jgi:hypothetical protein
MGPSILPVPQEGEDTIVSTDEDVQGGDSDMDGGFLHVFAAT